VTKELILFIQDLLESFDPYGVEHCTRVAEDSVRLAEVAGITRGTQELKDIMVAGLIHDLGKVKVPASILRINGKYLPAEYETMKLHAINGYKMLMRVVNGTINKDVALIVKYHHKDFSGGGYPEDEVKGNAIPRGARVLRLADSWDAMTTDRGYERAKTTNEAIADLIDHQIKFTAYDPELLRLFLTLKRNGIITVL
jgi:HD-GYP domain-containing protein (c-di-GMP phosphodiesterase class II)